MNHFFHHCLCSPSLLERPDYALTHVKLGMPAYWQCQIIFKMHSRDSTLSGMDTYPFRPAFLMFRIYGRISLVTDSDALLFMRA